MTDDEILTKLDRRLGEVDEYLPPVALSVVQQTTPVGPVRGTLRPMTRPFALTIAVVIGAVAAVAIFQQPLADVGHRTSSSIALSPPPVNGTRGPSPSVSAPSSRPLEIIRGQGYGELLMLKRLGWTGVCLVSRHALVVRSWEPADVDRAAEEAGIEEGWVEVGDSTRIWIGTEVQAAATALRASVLAIGEKGEPWVLIDGSGAELSSRRTPAGRTYWLATDPIRPCPSPS